MSLSTEELIGRNASFAATGAHVGLAFPTNQSLRVLGCVDSRVDPSSVLGLDVGLARQVLPPSLTVIGMVYDVETGLVAVVDPPGQG
jgi:carbonic anhydrase